MVMGVNWTSWSNHFIIYTNMVVHLKLIKCYM